MKEEVRSNEFDDYKLKDFASELTDEERERERQEALQILDEVVCSILKK